MRQLSKPFYNPPEGKKMKGSLPKPARSGRKKEFERPDTKGIELCSRCYAAFYRKRWNASLDVIKEIPSNISIRYTLCPACRQAADKLFEGEVVISGIAEKLFNEVLQRIKNIAKARTLKNPMARIIQLESDPKAGTIRILLSENQLARIIGRKVKEAFGGKMDIALSKEESTIRVRLDLSK